MIVAAALLLIWNFEGFSSSPWAQAQGYSGPRLYSSQVRVTNSYGRSDTVYVNQLKKGDVVRLYNSKGQWLGTRTSTGYSMTFYIKQLGASSGKVALTLAYPRKKAGSKTYFSYYSENSAPLKTSQIKVANNRGKADTVSVSGLNRGDIIWLYSADGQLLKTQTSGGSSTTLSIKQLSVSSSKLSLSVAHPYRRASGRTTVYYGSESSIALSPRQISVTNHIGASDEIAVTGLKKGDLVRVYSSKGQHIAAGTSDRSSLILTVPQLGAQAGSVYVTVTEPGYGPSGRTTADYKAEPIQESDQTTTYPYSFSYILNKQLGTFSQTDKSYPKFITAAGLKVSGTKGVVQATPAANDGDLWNVRGGASTSDWVITQVKQGKTVTVVKPVNASWYQIDFATGWVNPAPSDVHYYLDPSNFHPGEPEYFQFLDLSSPTSVSADEINKKILVNRGILTGKASAFIQAAAQQHINEIYLIAHALLETGNGSSNLAKGIRVTTVDGKAVKPMTVYNMYGIGAVDSDPDKGGSEYAYKQGWFTPEAAIIGGAGFIGSSYIDNPTYHQNTLYKMRWNPDRPATHQYASDIGWAVKQTSIISGLYQLLSSYSIRFDVPKYGN